MQLLALQVLRAIAAGLVVFVHGMDTYKYKVDPAASIELGEGLGTLGVKIFFCISGYIIFSSAMSLRPGWSSASGFMARRIIRIVPLYWCATLIYAAKLAIQGQAPTMNHLMASLLFLPFAEDGGPFMRPVLGTGWTLNFEMFFYAVLALTLLLVPAKRFWTVLSIFGLLMGARLSGVLIPAVGDTPSPLFYLSDSVLLYFVAGMVIGLLYDSVGVAKRAVWSIECGLAVAFLLLCGLVAMQHVLPPNSPALTGVELLLCAASVLACVGARHWAHAAVQRALHPVVIAGDGSYSTYLVHGFVMGPCARLLAVSGLSVGVMPFALAGVLLCSFVGVLIYRQFERPVTLALNRRWSQRPIG